MKCPKCNKDDDHVVDSRSSEDKGVIRRRRECRFCKARYTTYERIEKAVPLKVLKKTDHIRETFEPEKLRRSIDSVCHKLDFPSEKIEKMTEDLIKEIDHDFNREVPSYEISKRVMAKLKSFHQIAYVRYGSAYIDFNELESFLSPLLPFVSKVESVFYEKKQKTKNPSKTKKKENRNT